MGEFSPVSVSLMELLDRAKKGELVIPNFQRDFVWGVKQIEELLNSVINGYFIGSILLLESPLNDPRFGPRLIRGVKPESVRRDDGNNTIAFVLDGQQRITSLYYAMFEPDIPVSEDYPNLKVRFFIRPDSTDVYGLIDPEYLARKFGNSKEMADYLYKMYRDNYGIDLKQLPSMGIFKDSSSLENYLDSNPSLTASFKQRLYDLYGKIQGYKIPVITLPKETTDEDIVNTFERINRTGTPLNVFDLAVARYYPSGINLVTYKNEIKNRLFLKFIDEISVLKTMALFKDMEPKPQNLFKLIDRSSNEDTTHKALQFRNEWNKAVAFLEEATTRLTKDYAPGVIKHGKGNMNLVPYTTLIVPVAVLLSEIKSRNNQQKLYKRLDFWYWSTVFSQRYTHGTDSKSYSDIKQMKKWFDNSAERPNIIPNFEEVKKEMSRASINSALAKAFFAQLLLNECKDIFTGQSLSDVHVDHIFPRSKMGREADTIFNLTLLSSNTNQEKKQDKLPSQFLTECLVSHGNNQDNLIKTLDSHFINVEAYNALLRDDFESFLQARADYFAEKMKAKLESLLD
ncbi:MAG: DUF262 domain-containing protein [Candidatus Micrarchaeaceae archaeon]